MKQYPCPVCGSRVCDSDRILEIQKLSDVTVHKADLAIKCKACKCRLTITLAPILASQSNGIK